MIISRLIPTLFFLAIIVNSCSALSITNPIIDAHAASPDIQTYSFQVTSDNGVTLTSESWITVPKSLPPGNLVPAIAEIHIPPGITTSGELRGTIVITENPAGDGTVSAVGQYRLPVKMYITPSETPLNPVTTVTTTNPSVTPTRGLFEIYETGKENGILLGMFLGTIALLCIMFYVTWKKKD